MKCKREHENIQHVYITFGCVAKSLFSLYNKQDIQM